MKTTQTITIIFDLKAEIISSNGRNLAEREKLIKLPTLHSAEKTLHIRSIP